ncbi:hypothetical protein CEY09_00660 [Achromobacter marplatensis]|jgi:hypothetical protein|uniref:DUF3348 domain-containing protein n=2 Tax=Achromobacter marplatensis TaxID=470868 RepID=A0AA42W8C6_9BURK|nr:DUF3348 domain-containing protein [Achromobacter marplatensis]MDH2049763.1 DUF3348 domain-containing protein [Achromobacter marplatensis]OWT72063.1 hypothetical protein CEY09_00660 [Achromobacter marplatensis]RBP24668.1 uncharacterized protein DUF3348 [Achromobacter marplatensis]CAB3625244.1 hypothetical protein LMG26219_00130 [Achromobacter marplatensis]
MLQAPQRTGLSGPTLIRLLTRLTDVDVPESRQSLSDHLSQWLGWTDAIALSAALNTSPPVIAPGARTFSSAEERECMRVRTTLADAIASDTAATAAKRPIPGQAPAKKPAAVAEAEADYSNFRQRYQSLQHTMETSVGNLRSRLRGMVAAKNGEMTRLAVVDAIMDRALLPKERALLGVIPKLLGGHFDRLRLAEAAALAEASADTQTEDGAGAEAEGATAPEPAPVSITPGAWLDVFRKDMRSVLLAELDVRLQPVEGLLAALRAS